MSKLSKGQRKIARMAMPFDKITGADFKVLKNEKTKERQKEVMGELKKMARPEMGAYWN